MTKNTDAMLARIMDAESNMWQGVVDGSIETVNSSGWNIHEEEMILTCNKQEFETWLFDRYLLRDYESTPQSGEGFIDLVKFEFVCLLATPGRYKYSFILTEPLNDPQIRQQLLEAARTEFRLEHDATSTGQGRNNITKPESKALPRIPKQAKRLNDWKAAWRKVKGRWKGGGNYRELAQLANVSPETIADIVKAGDAGLLD